MGGLEVIVAEGVVVEGDAVDLGDEQEGPVRAALGFGDRGGVVDGKEDVGCAREVWECGFERERVGGLEEHEGHGGAEEDDVCAWEPGQLFALEVFLPECNALCCR